MLFRTWYLISLVVSALLFHRLWLNTLSSSSPSSSNRDCLLDHCDHRDTLRSIRYNARFCVFPNLIKSELSEQLERITLILHLTMGYVDDRLVEQVHYWDGPVSLTVFVDQKETKNDTSTVTMTDSLLNAYRMMKKLRECHRDIAHKLSVHLLYRHHHDHDRQCLSISKPSSSSSSTCSPLPAESSEQQQTDRAHMYPANAARNIARLYTKSTYIIIGDYEQLFSLNFESKILPLARRELSNGDDNRKALVYRIFEFDDIVKEVPRTKQQLFDLFKKGKAIEFHDRFNKGSHRIPGLSTFFARVENDSTVAVQLIQPYNRHTWEPQFVSLNTIPMHDERFPYGIRDNTVLRWELCRMGYRFLVVTDVFNVHRGIKSSSSVNKTRMLQNRVRARFNKAVKAFRLRMDSEYPQSKSLCPPCRA